MLGNAATGAWAQAPKGRISLTGQVGGCIPKLTDVNQGVRYGNDALRRYGWDTMNEIGLASLVPVVGIAPLHGGGALSMAFAF